MRQLAAALATLTLLASCSSTQRMYEGDARSPEEVARVEPWERGIGSAMATGLFVGIAQKSIERPHTISIQAVDGVETEKRAVELLPGEHTILAQGYSSWPDSTPSILATGEISFTAAAGRTYQVTARASSHCPPWAFEVREKGQEQLLGTSEGRFEDVTLVAPPFDGRNWEVSNWMKSGDSEGLSFNLNGETHEQWTELVEVLRYPLENEAMTLEEAGNFMAEAKRKRRVDVDLRFEGDRWIERWATQSKKESQWQWGVTVGEVASGKAQAWVFASKKPLDEELGAEWESLLLSAE